MNQFIKDIQVCASEIKVDYLKRYPSQQFQDELTPNYQEIFQAIKLLRGLFKDLPIQVIVFQLYRFINQNLAFKKDDKQNMQNTKRLKKMNEEQELKMRQKQQIIKIYLNNQHIHGESSVGSKYNIQCRTQRKYKALIKQIIQEAMRFLQNFIIEDCKTIIYPLKFKNKCILFYVLHHFKSFLDEKQVDSYGKMVQLSHGIGPNSIQIQKNDMLRLYQKLWRLMQDDQVKKQVKMKKKNMVLKTKEQIRLSLQIIEQNIKNIVKFSSNLDIQRKSQQRNDYNKQDPSQRQPYLLIQRKEAIFKDKDDLRLSQKYSQLKRFFTNNTQEHLQIDPHKRYVFTIIDTYRKIQNILQEYFPNVIKLQYAVMQVLHNKILYMANNYSKKSCRIFTGIIKAENNKGEERISRKYEDVYDFYEETMKLIIQLNQHEATIQNQNLEPRQKTFDLKRYSLNMEISRTLQRFKEVKHMKSPLFNNNEDHKALSFRNQKKIVAEHYIRYGYGRNHVQDYCKSQNIQTYYKDLLSHGHRYKMIVHSIVVQTFRYLESFLIQDQHMNLCILRTAEMHVLQEILSKIRQYQINYNPFFLLIIIVLNLSQLHSHQIKLGQTILFYYKIMRILQYKLDKMMN